MEGYFLKRSPRPHDLGPVVLIVIVMVAAAFCGMGQCSLGKTKLQSYCRETFTDEVLELPPTSYDLFVDHFRGLRIV